MAGWVHFKNSLNEKPEESKVKELEEEIKKIRESRDAWKKQCSEYEQALVDSRKDVETLQLQVKTLQGVIATNKTPLSEFPTPDLIKEMFRRLGVGSAKNG